MTAAGTWREMLDLLGGDPQARFAALSEDDLETITLPEAVGVLFPGWAVVAMGRHRLAHLAVLRRGDSWLLAVPHHADAANWPMLTPSVRTTVISVMFRDDHVHVATSLDRLIGHLAARANRVWTEEVFAAEFLLSLEEAQVSRTLAALGGLDDLASKIAEVNADLARLHGDLRAQQQAQHLAAVRAQPIPVGEPR